MQNFKQKSMRLRSQSLIVKEKHRTCVQNQVFESWFKKAERRINLQRELNQAAQEFYIRVQNNQQYLILKKFKENAVF